jgi:DNA-binding transcriptional LysR family regulator
MKKTVAGWDHYRTFLEVARDGSLSGAARRLGLTQPTAGRHIDTLEKALGVLLFVRSRRGLEPTAAALELLPHAEAMAASHNAILRAATGESASEKGTIRITASEIISNEVLPAILAPFCDRHRQLVIELVSSNRMQNLIRRDSDIAVRMLRPVQEEVVARRVGAIEIGLYAHKTYIEARGLPSTMEELTSHRIIGFDRDDLAFRSAVKEFEVIQPNLFGFRCDSDAAQLAALRAGVGIGGCQKGIAMADEDLIPVLPDSIAFGLEIWVCMHDRLKSVRRVRLLFDDLCDGLAKYARAGKSKVL